MKFGRSLIVAAIALATACAADISTAKPPSTSFTKAPATNSRSAECSSACSKIYKPVCGSDGVTYSNDCVLGVAQCESGGLVTQVSDGECPASSSSSASSSSAGCSDVCLDVYDPATDENGVQYSNECYRRMAQCKATSGSASTLEDIGASNETERVSSNCDNRVCTMDYAPVCGSNGETYSNSCMLSLAKCKNSSIIQTADGECASSERV